MTQSMKKELRWMSLYQQRIMADKAIEEALCIGRQAGVDVVSEAWGESFCVYRAGKLRLPKHCLATLSLATKRYSLKESQVLRGGNELWEGDFVEGDWAIIHLAPQFELLLYWRERGLDTAPMATALAALNARLGEPLVYFLVLSFALHSLLLFLGFWYAEDSESVVYQGLESRWLELSPTLAEPQEEEKEDLPIVEDSDDVIVDPSLLDDKPMAEHKPQSAPVMPGPKAVGIQAAFNSSKLRDMESLFGSTQGLGAAFDTIIEGSEGEPVGGVGFGSDLMGLGFGTGAGGLGGGGGAGLGSLGRGASGASDGSARGQAPKRAKAKLKPAIALETAQAGAFCQASNISTVVKNRANTLRNCYEQQLLAEPSLSGKIVVLWKIGLEGQVTEASIKSTTMKNEAVEACLLRSIRRLRFDAPDGGICVVEFPFVFSAAQ